MEKLYKVEYISASRGEISFWFVTAKTAVQARKLFRMMYANKLISCKIWV